MLPLCIKAESQKLHRSPIWLACFLLPLIPALYGTYTYLQNTGILTGKWYSLWSQLTLFYAIFFYAPLIALYCSYLWRLEHLNHNWNVLMTSPVSIRDIFLGKLTIILKVTVFTQLWLFALYLLCGKIIGLPGLPDRSIFLWGLRGTFAAVAIGSLQLLLSMIIRSFAVPIGIALAGSILGMLAANQGFGMYFPYALMLMGMNSNKETDVLSGSAFSFLLGCGFYFLLFTGISIRILKTKDVKA